jgi:hypothetical protein
MLLEGASFDAVITDKNGRKLEVDCRVTEPDASGQPASISIEVPLNRIEHEVLENPCSLHGADSDFEVEIKDLWYREIPAGGTHRKHARGVFDINHAGQLWVKRARRNNELAKLRFLLSPVRFFEKHGCAVLVNYAALPNMTVELFKLTTQELGEIRFIKFWYFDHTDRKGVAAQIHTSFGAEILYDETIAHPIERLVRSMREVLVPLSILTRQAIALHGWVWEKQECAETMWFDPLDPNLAPEMTEEPAIDLCFQDEFDAHAQALVEKFLEAPPDTREAITLISGALAPYVKRPAAGNFSALFNALEQVVALEKLTREERKKLRETDEEVIIELNKLKAQVEETSSPSAAKVAARIAGFAKSVNESRPSFNVRFEKFQAAHPKLAEYTSDLWPLRGTARLPGLKQMRDSLAHGLRHEYSTQAIAVAHWHLARLLERLAFVVLGTDVPRGLHSNSSQLKRDPWYNRSEWEAIRAAAKTKN